MKAEGSFRVYVKCILLALAVLAGAVLPCIWKVQADDNFGADAYSYMEYLSANFPQRWAGTGTVEEARNWLISTVRGFGYSDLQIDYCEGTSPFGWGDYTGYNISFTKQGASEKKIVVCAHYDCASTSGADDNASGVGVLLETAKRIFYEELPYTVQFILFDAEEPGCLGSWYYVNHASSEYLDSILCVINIDSIAAGDVMYAYGGDVDEQGNFVRTWALWQVMEISQGLNINLNTHPDVNADYPSPTKKDGSDQTAFNAAGIPYVYFEASYWQGGDYTNFCQTADPRIPNGKIMHVAEFDNLPFLNEAFPERASEHVSAYSRLLYEILHQLKDPAQTQPASSEEAAEPTLAGNEEITEAVEPDSSEEETQASETASEDTKSVESGGVEEDTKPVEPDSSDDMTKSEHVYNTEETVNEVQQDNTEGDAEPSREETEASLISEQNKNNPNEQVVLVLITALAAVGVCGIIYKYRPKK